ncbi:MAG: ATP synthase subunit I [Desulfobacteraceae bacterium]|jgi:F1F0 ATPase subunit 2|nr:ATP synthase subunit I [Desulfobacteraceae bacterium]
MSVDWLDALLTMSAGAGTGAFYFGGLWWTVRRLPGTRRPAGLSLASFLLRAAAVMAVFYLLADGSPVHWIQLLAGFTLARLVLLRRIGRAEKDTQRFLVAPGRGFDRASQAPTEQR